jgi:hypothetical protein
MTLTKTSNSSKGLILILTFIISTQIFSQSRKDEEMPKIISSIKSINNLNGWSKNDIGKWEEFNASFGTIKNKNQVLRIDLAEINYEGKLYLCVAGFTKSFYIKSNTKYIEYCAFFWLLDSAKKQDLIDVDTTVHTRLYQNFIVSSIVGGYFKPITWRDILVQMKKCFIGTYPNDYDTSYQERREERERYNLPTLPNIDPFFDPFESFFIKYRYDKNKTQFYIGTLADSYLSRTGEFSFKDAFLLLDCYDKEENRNLNCRYFEVPKNIFDNCFKNILK